MVFFSNGHQKNVYKLKKEITLKDLGKKLNSVQQHWGLSTIGNDDLQYL